MTSSFASCGLPLRISPDRVGMAAAPLLAAVRPGGASTKAGSVPLTWTFGRPARNPAPTAPGGGSEVLSVPAGVDRVDMTPASSRTTRKVDP